MKKRIQTLDGVRGIAILLVLNGHATDTTAAGYTGWLTPLKWLPNSEVGVQIFFVLSGYLITSILIREYDAIGKIDIKAFYCRRILRIFPAFYLFLLFIVGLNAVGAIQLSRTYLALSAAHLVNYAQAIILLLKLTNLPNADYWFIGHLWTLSMEEQFYWMWPLALLFLLRTRWYGVLVVLVLGMPLIRVASYDLFPGLRGQIMMMLHTGSDAIFAGCLLAVCLARHPGLSRKLIFSPWVVAILVVYIFKYGPLLNRMMPRGFGVVLGATLMIGAIVLTLANILLHDGNAWYNWVLLSPPLVFLGRISYSVYLWQQVFLTPLDTTLLGKWPLNLVAAIGVGWLSYQFVELPFIRLKDKYFPAHAKPAIPVEAEAVVVTGA